jgi:hypothetical protein
MRPEEHVQILRLIEKAVLAVQGRYHPGRPMFYALGRVHDELRRAQREAERSASPRGSRLA